MSTSFSRQRTIAFIVSEQDLQNASQPEKWLSFAARRFTELQTWSKAKKERHAGRLILNGEKVLGHIPVKVGDRIELISHDTECETEEKKDAIARSRAILDRMQVKAEVLMEMDEYAVIFKPAGYHVCGVSGTNIESMLPALLKQPYLQGPNGLPSPVAVHRLDYRVPGLLLIAKSRTAVVHLGKMFETKQIVKRYRALLSGKLSLPPKTSINKDGASEGCLTGVDVPSTSELEAVQKAEQIQSAFQNTDSSSSREGSYDNIYAIREPIDGRPSVSLIRVVSHSPSYRYGSITTVDLWPLSGRQHQLRIHCAFLGFPIIGDDLHYCHPFGDTSAQVERGFDQIEKTSAGNNLVGIYKQLNVPQPLAERYSRTGLAEARERNEKASTPLAYEAPRLREEMSTPSFGVSQLLEFHSNITSSHHQGSSAHMLASGPLRKSGLYLQAVELSFVDHNNHPVHVTIDERSKFKRLREAEQTKYSRRQQSNSVNQT